MSEEQEPVGAGPVGARVGADGESIAQGGTGNVANRIEINLGLGVDRLLSATTQSTPFVDRLRRVMDAGESIPWDHQGALTVLLEWRQLYLCCGDAELGMAAAAHLLRAIPDHPAVGVLKEDDPQATLEAELRHPELGGGLQPLVVLVPLGAENAAALYETLSAGAAGVATRDEWRRQERFVVFLVQRTQWVAPPARVQELHPIDLWRTKVEAARPELSPRLEELRERAGARWSDSTVFERVRRLDPSAPSFLDDALRPRGDADALRAEVTRCVGSAEGTAALMRVAAWVSAFLSDDGLPERSFSRVVEALLRDLSVPAWRVEWRLKSGERPSTGREVPDTRAAVEVWRQDRLGILGRLGLVVEGERDDRMIVYRDPSLRDTVREVFRASVFVLDEAAEAVVEAGLLFDPDPDVAAGASRFVTRCCAAAAGRLPKDWWVHLLTRAGPSVPFRRVQMLVRDFLGEPILRSAVADLLDSLIERHLYPGLPLALAFHVRAMEGFDAAHWFRQVLERGNQADRIDVLRVLTRAAVLPDGRTFETLVAWLSPDEFHPYSKAAEAGRLVSLALGWGWVEAAMAPLPSGLLTRADPQESASLALRLLGGDAGDTRGRHLAGLETPQLVAAAGGLTYASLLAWMLAPEVLLLLNETHLRGSPEVSAILQRLDQRLEAAQAAGAEHGNEVGHATLLTIVAAWIRLADGAEPVLVRELCEGRSAAYLGDLAGWASMIDAELGAFTDDLCSLARAPAEPFRAAVRELDGRRELLGRIGPAFARGRQSKLSLPRGQSDGT